MPSSADLTRITELADPKKKGIQTMIQVDMLASAQLTRITQVAEKEKNTEIPDR